MNYYGIKKFCREPMNLIENWDKAIADDSHRWDCHHKLEIELGMSKGELIKAGLYFNRPASELIMLTHEEHAALHNRNGEKVRQMNESWRGKHHTEEAKRNISEKQKGRQMT